MRYKNLKSRPMRVPREFEDLIDAKQLQIKQDLGVTIPKIKIIKIITEKAKPIILKRSKQDEFNGIKF